MVFQKRSKATPVTKGTKGNREYKCALLRPDGAEHATWVILESKLEYFTRMKKWNYPW